MKYSRIAVREEIIMKYCETCGHYNVCKDKANYVVNCPEHIEPVRYGKWEGLRCSECGHISWSNTNYCQHCGAKMEGE